MERVLKDTAEKSFAELGSTKHTWSAITAKDYQAFTPALLYWGTTLDRDMVRDFAARLNKSTRIKMCISPMPVFDIENPVRELRIDCGGATGEKVERLDLSRTIYFCPKSIWPELREFMTAFCSVDIKAGRVAFAGECPVMNVPDYVRLAEGYVPPGFIPVASVGVYASDFCSLWRWNLSNPYERPKAVRAPRHEVAYQDGLLFMESR